MFARELRRLIYLRIRVRTERVKKLLSRGKRRKGVYPSVHLSIFLSASPTAALHHSAIQLQSIFRSFTSGDEKYLLKRCRHCRRVGGGGGQGGNAIDGGVDSMTLVKSFKIVVLSKGFITC